MDDMLNLGLIGAGRIGRLHAEHVATRIPNARTLIVADVDAVLRDAPRQSRATTAACPWSWRWRRGSRWRRTGR